MKYIVCPVCGQLIVPEGEELIDTRGVRQSWTCDHCTTHLDTVVQFDQYHLNRTSADWKDFLFSGENGEFLVELDLNKYDTFEDALVAATEVATEADPCPEFCALITQEQGDVSGLDTY